jgi:hypothetical protein
MERTDIHGGQSPGEWSDQPENLNIPFAAKKPHVLNTPTIEPFLQHPGVEKRNEIMFPLELERRLQQDVDLEVAQQFAILILSQPQVDPRDVQALLSKWEY